MTPTPLNLEGSAIRLIPMAHLHLDDLCAIGLEPRLWQATTIQVRTRLEMEAYIQTALAAQSAGHALPFVIEERATGTIIGSTRYHSIVPEHRRLEIGFTWVALPWQRTIVNTEAKFLMLCHAFETWHCLRVEFRADSENEQSCRALLRIGARPEGVLRSYRVTVARGIRDLAVFSIIAPEWPTVRACLEARLKENGRSQSPFGQSDDARPCD